MKRLIRPPVNPALSPKDENGQYIKAPPVKKEEPTPVFELKTFLFDKQLRFVEDPHPFKVAVCSRRSGKTVACAADLVHTAINNPGTVCLYITLSRNNAKKLIWPEIRKINRHFKLGGVEDQTELSLTFPNGAIIYCSGAKDASEIEKFRGLALKKAYIDECQSFRDYISELIDDVISPALMDYAGTLCLIGTPGPVPSGYFHDCSEKSEEWAKHKWTFFDNPHITKKSGLTHQALLERELKRRNVKADSPKIQREFFGRWVLDSDSLILHYNADVNNYDKFDPTKTKYSYVMGIDLGYEDSDALAVLAYSDDSPVTYLVDEVVVNKQGITELVAQIQALRKKYDVCKMVIDSGGLGKKIAEELIRRHQIPVEAADKTRKMENLEFLDDSLRTGRLKARSSSKFAQDTYLVEKDRHKSKPDRIVISDRYHSDIIDAVLYAYKLSPAYSYQAPKKKAALGTPEWDREQEDEMWNRAKEHFDEQAEIQRRIDQGGEYFD